MALSIRRNRLLLCCIIHDSSGDFNHLWIHEFCFLTKVVLNINKAFNRLSTSRVTKQALAYNVSFFSGMLRWNARVWLSATSVPFPLTPEPAHETMSWLFEGCMLLLVTSLTFRPLVRNAERLWYALFFCLCFEDRIFWLLYANRRRQSIRAHCFCMVTSLISMWFPIWPLTSLPHGRVGVWCHTFKGYFSYL